MVEMEAYKSRTYKTLLINKEEYLLFEIYLYLKMAIYLALILLINKLTKVFTHHLVNKNHKKSFKIINKFHVLSEIIYHFNCLF